MKAWWHFPTNPTSMDMTSKYSCQFNDFTLDYQKSTRARLDRWFYSGVITDFSSFIQKLKDIENGTELYRCTSFNNDILSIYMGWATSLMKIGMTSTPTGMQYSIELYSIDAPDTKDRIQNVCREYIKKDVPRGSVFALSATGKDLDLQPIGIASMPLEPTNYDPTIVNKVQHVIEDLKKTDPCGRFIVLDGPPGTGKTSVIKAIIGSVDATFIMVQAQNITEWTGPDLIGLLNSKKNELKTPLVFILEDSDSCLVPRQDGNMTALGVLLNLTDGIWSGLYDIRAIASTNADIEDLDPALTRSMRLCRRICIDELDAEQANGIYRRITNTLDSPFTEPVVLADIYKLIKDPQGKEPGKKDRRIGFGRNNE